MSEEYNLEDVSNPEELIRIGRELANKEQYDKAIVFLEKAHTIDPKHLQALNSLGFANGRSGKYEVAIHWYKKALEIEPKFQKALGNLAHVYQMQGKYAEAIKFYKKSLEANPDDPDLRFPPDIIKVVEEHLQKTIELAEKE